VNFDWSSPDYEAAFAYRLDVLKRIREEGLTPKLREHFAKNPIDFIEMFGMTFDPRNAEVGLPTTVPFILFQRQKDFINWIHQRWLSREDGLAEKTRDMGVSWLCVAYAVWMWLFREGVVIGFGSRKEEYVDKLGDPKSLFWKIREFIRLLPDEFKPKGYDPKRHAPFMTVTNPETGSAIVGEAGDNIGRGARASIYFVDEAAYLERPMLIEAALSQTANCRIDVSTPNGPDNPFATKRRSGKVPVFTFHWRDDPRKNEAWYERQKATKDPIIVAQEIDINYEASTTNAMISGDLVMEAQSRGKADVSHFGPGRISVDVARFGNNETVISFVRGRACLWQQVFRTQDTVFVAGKVRQIVQSMKSEVHQIAVDDIGVGGGVTDQLRQWFPKLVKPVNAALRVDDGVNYNLRAQMYANLLDWLRDGPVSIPNDPELKAQLCGIKYQFRGGLRILQSKKEMTSSDIAENVSRSPDRADSLALAFAIPASETDDDHEIEGVEWGVLDEVTAY
jgi:hypothetical protein